MLHLDRSICRLGKDSFHIGEGIYHLGENLCHFSEVFYHLVDGDCHLGKGTLGKGTLLTQWCPDP